jgi:hypothetical protein
VACRLSSLALRQTARTRQAAYFAQFKPDGTRIGALA